MTIIDPGYSEAAATVFTWLADKALGGAKKALGWGWERAQWVAAQDRYDEQIIKQYGWIRVFGQTTPKLLKGVFTDVYMLDKPTAFSRFDPKTLRRHLWEQDRSVPFRLRERLPADQLLGRGSKFIILGKPGAGKTTFLKHLAVREAQRGKWGLCLGKIPIFVPLKQFAESGKSLFDFIVAQFAVCHFPDATPFVKRLLKEGKALVLFDGLDEVAKGAGPRADHRGQVTKLIEEFSRQYDGCHIFITCRIAATEYTFDPAFIYLELADFAPDQVEVFVRNWFWDPAEPDWSAELADQMLKAWEQPEHTGIRDLGRNPLLLTLLCLNYAETLSFPARRVEIYQEALDALLKKWDASRQIQRGSLYRTLSLGRKQQMFSRIAYDGFLRGEILFSQADLEAQLKAYLAHAPEVPEAIDIDAEALLAEIVEQHGIFAEQTHRVFSFAHLTFQEYYAAKHFAEGVEPDAPEKLIAYITDVKWREVFLLTASLLSDATQFLATYEEALHRLVASRPELASWLRWIDEQAGFSQAGYRRSATRVFYIRSHAPILPDSTTDSLAFDLDRALAFDLALDIARSLDVYRTIGHSFFDIDRALTLALDLDRGYIYTYTDAFRLILKACRQQGRLALYEALSALVVPALQTSKEAWRGFFSELTQVIETHGALGSYRRLRAEADRLAEEHERRWHLDHNDREVFNAFINISRLFYDCLQLAYTPDRHSFEERILLPPPLTEQKA